MMVVIIIPLVVGKLVREFSSRVREFVAKYKSELKVTSSLFLISVPWMSMSAAADDIGRARFSDILLLIILGTILHIVLLLFNFYACDLLAAIPGFSIGLKEKKAVVISASQKTLNTAVSVIAFLPASLGDKGLITVPSIIAHCVQIIIDGFLVSWWKKQQDGQQLVEDQSKQSGQSLPKQSEQSIASSSSLSSQQEIVSEKAATIEIEEAVEDKQNSEDLWKAKGGIEQEQKL